MHPRGEPLNPYAPPAMQDVLPAPVFVPGYRSTSGLQRIVTAALYAGLGASLLGILSDAVEIQALQRDPLQAEAFETQVLLVSGLQTLISLVTAVVFARFLIFTNRNARALGAQGMRFTPGWTVGWFFVPIANLYKPYQAVRELWQVHDPDMREAWRAAPVPGLLGVWWAAWLVSSVIGQIAFRLSWHAEDIESYLTASYVGIGAQLWDIPLTLLALFVVRGLHDRQQRAAHARGL